MVLTPTVPSSQVKIQHHGRNLRALDLGLNEDDICASLLGLHPIRHIFLSDLPLPSSARAGKNRCPPLYTVHHPNPSLPYLTLAIAY